MESNVEENGVDTTADATSPAGDAASEKPVRRRAPRRASAAAGTTPDAVEAPAAAPAEAAAAPAAEEAPKKRATRSRKKPVEAEAPAEDAAPAASAAAPAETAGAAADASAGAAADASAGAAAEEAPKKRATRSRKKPAEAEAPAEDAAPTSPAAAAPEAPAASPAADAPSEAAPAAAPAKSGRRRARAEAGEAKPAEDQGAEAKQPAAEQGEAQQARAGQGEAKQPRDEQARAEQAETKSGAKDAAESKSADAAEDSSEAGDAERGGRSRRGRGRTQQKTEKPEERPEPDGAAEAGDENKGRGQSQNGDRNGAGKNGEKNGESRSSRTRQRDRKRRGQSDDLEPELTEDDVLLPIAGILDVLDNYAFVRTSGYLPGLSDVYVSLGQVKKYGLRRGDAVVGAIRQPREGEGGGRQKYNAIVKIDTVNAKPVEENEKRPEITDLTPVYPQERLRLAATPLGRAIDAVAPVGLGQRGLLVLRGAAPASRVLQEIADGVSASRPDAHLMLVLTDARPEEVTRLQRSVRGEVVAATFERSAEDQATVVELSVERAKRLVELGHDVVVLVDSLTSLAHAFASGHQGRAETPEAFAVAQVKRLLSAARNVENGGSLTLLATALAKTGVDADRELLRAVRAIANSEIRFEKAPAGIVPAVDLARSRTLGADEMLSADEAAELTKLRTELASDDDAADRLAERLRAQAE